MDDDGGVGIARYDGDEALQELIRIQLAGEPVLANLEAIYANQEAAGRAQKADDDKEPGGSSTSSYVASSASDLLI